ncbi:MAG TPA: c-type cytochrome [Ignavibacteriales bacterium]|nr:c-type cytochrome [Ignavibacteriales bacterium]
MRKNLSIAMLILAGFAFVITQLQCSNQNKENKKMSHDEQVSYGKYLVNVGGCNDCHSPKIMTAQGPVPDSAKLLSGHPAGEALAPVDTTITNSKWIFASMDLTAWAGPWGISFAANLTPDGQTGIGAWDENVFLKALKEGKHMGSGRPILPPMPWQSIGQMKDEDLKAVFAYLKSLKPIDNKVPDPIPPNMVAQATKAGK